MLFLIDPPSERMGRARVELVRGWAHAVEGAPLLPKREAPPRGPDRLRALLVAAEAKGAEARFDDEAELDKRGACAPFHPAAALRAHLAPRLDPDRARRILSLRALTLRLAPDPTCLDDDERPLIAYLRRRRTLEELTTAALCPPRRAGLLLAFLLEVGALDVDDSPFSLLGLDEGASKEQIKRAYHRLAREHHPDHHPAATPEERRALVERFDELQKAYRRLLG